MKAEKDDVLHVEHQALSDEISSLKAKLNEQNKLKEALYKKRADIGKQIREKIGNLRSSLDERDKLTGNVKDLKKRRDELNHAIKEKIKEISALKETHGITSVPRRAKSSLSLVRQKIEQLTFKLETEVMSFDKEKQLRAKIKEFSKALNEAGAEEKAMHEYFSLSKVIDKLKKEANVVHRKIQDIASNSQNKHEHLMTHSDEIAKLKEAEKEVQEKFLVAKDAFNKLNVELKEKIGSLNSVKGAISSQLKASDQLSKKEQDEILRSKGAEVEDKIKKKGKLTMEDLLILQSAEKQGVMAGAKKEKSSSAKNSPSKEKASKQKAKESPSTSKDSTETEAASNDNAATSVVDEQQTTPDQGASSESTTKQEK
ncbi:MAG: hypothetical protein H6502_05610 [Candidatus Woesearchaeota archaeon]|nr:MAG: hypothetical protein H6502_05610 [Candidatus Woesearchaeota archaeon]